MGRIGSSLGRAELRLINRLTRTEVQFTLQRLAWMRGKTNKLSVAAEVNRTGNKAGLCHSVNSVDRTRLCTELYLCAKEALFLTPDEACDESSILMDASSDIEEQLRWLRQQALSSEALSALEVLNQQRSQIAEIINKIAALS